MNPSEFAAKWSGSERTERAASQEHFIDLCRMLGVQTPNEADQKGEWYAFEKGAEKTEGGDGFADVWKKGHFAWEYKGKRKDLKAAYRQLLQYREALENPPLLVVCDLDRFEVHTNFTDTAKQVHSFTLAELAEQPEGPIRVLRSVMSNPEALRPVTTREQLTENAATAFAQLAQALRGRGHDPHRVAHFLNKLLFCMFAQDVGLLPAGLIERLADSTANEPDAFADGLRDVFGKMAKAGGRFGVEKIDWFNGGLFDGDDVLSLAREEVDTIRSVSRLDWSDIEPAIFGTLFERGLDPNSRASLGAHYTDRNSIERIIEPVVLAPLRREFDTLKAEIESLDLPGKNGVAATRSRTKAEKLLDAFLDRLSAVRVLDPACGSGNFLYIALRSLKDLEHAVILWAAFALKTGRLPRVGPEVVHGIEVNDYAAELARVTIWIGEIQWMLDHGYGYQSKPILKPLENIECRDAILDLSDPERAVEAAWPDAEFIVGNPPFLGTKKLRAGLGDDYVEKLFAVFAARIPNFSDLCCYWFEKARAMIERGRCRRAGLLATQGIRNPENRRVLQRIGETGGIFSADSEREWVLAGAAVRVSVVCFDDGTEMDRLLDGQSTRVVNTDLTLGVDVTKAGVLAENRSVAFYSDVKGGPFEVSNEVAAEWLAAPNPHGRPNAEVVRPWVNSLDVLRRPRHMWIVDFGVDMSHEAAALFEKPFAYVQEHVAKARQAGRPTRSEWWLHMRPCPGMRNAVASLARFAVTPTIAKHRVIVWLENRVLADHQLIVFARDDDYFLGVLHSKVHERWSLAVGTALEDRPRYTPTTCFESFPFPRATDGLKRANSAGAQQLRDRVAASAVSLAALRNRWLNPTEADQTPALSDAALRRRTLTNLYNERPAWLENAHLELDRAVLAAYGWPEEWADGLQPVRDQKGHVNPALGVRDPAIEQMVLSRLLELNLSLPHSVRTSAKATER